MRATSIDFESFFYASKSVFTDGISPFEVKTILAQNGTFVVPPFLYPPPALLLFYPLHMFDLESAARGFFALNVLSLLVVAGILVMESRRVGASVPWVSFLVIAAVSSYPAYQSLIIGQVNLLTGLLILAFAISYDRNRPLLAAMFLGGACLLKTTPLIFAVPLLIHREFVVLRNCAMYLFGTGVLSAAVLPTGILGSWVAFVGASGGVSAPVPGLAQDLLQYNIGIAGSLVRFFGFGDKAHILHLALVMCIVAACSMYSFIGRRMNSSLGMSPSETALYVVAMILVSPITWVHHLAMLFPVLAFAMMDMRAADTRRGLPQRALFLACFCGLVVKWDYIVPKGFIGAISITLVFLVLLWAVLIQQRLAGTDYEGTTRWRRV